MFLELILALSLGSVAHSLKAYDDICPLLTGVEWVQSPDRPNEEGIWFVIAAMENPIFSPSKMTCPKESYVRVNDTYIYNLYSNEVNVDGMIELEGSDVGLVGELNIGSNVFRIQCVDLDYASWGLMYICGNEVGDDLDFEIFYVVSRHRTLAQADYDTAKALISKYGGDPAALVNFKQTGCE